MFKRVNKIAHQPGGVGRVNPGDATGTWAAPSRSVLLRRAGLAAGTALTVPTLLAAPTPTVEAGGLPGAASPGAPPSVSGYYVETAPGVRVFVQDVGAGPPIVLVHGFALNSRSWEYQTGAFAQAGFRVVAPDLRGFGWSDKPLGPYTYDAFAGDIAAVLEALDLRGVTLLGHSLGGAIALHTAATHPGRVARLVLADAAAPVGARRPDYPYGPPPSALQPFIDLLARDRPAALAAFAKTFFHTAVSPQFAQWFQDLNLEAAPWASLAAFDLLRDTDLRADLPRVRVSTLVVQGLDDQVTVKALTGDRLAAGIAGARYLTYRQCGHGVWYDQKDRFNRDVLAFAR